MNLKTATLADLLALQKSSKDTIVTADLLHRQGGLPSTLSEPVAHIQLQAVQEELDRRRTNAEQVIGLKPKERPRHGL